MKRILWCVLSLLVWGLLLGVSPLEAEDKDYEVEMSIGAAINNVDDQANRVVEYSRHVDMDRNWYFQGKLSYFGDFLFKLQGKYQDVDEQNYRGFLDWKRFLVYRTEFNRFYHRLDHDNLSNLEAHSMAALKTVTKGTLTKWVTSDVAGAGLATVYHTDFNPTDHYGITRSEWKNRLDIHLPVLPQVVFEFQHRYESRKGYDQARTMSKCASCHVVAKSKFIDEFTNDYVPKVRARFGALSLEYAFLYRNFYNSSSVPYNIYNEAQRPVSGDGTLVKPGAGLLLFDAELQFDASDGPLPFARTPEIRKKAHKLKAKYDFSTENQIYLGYVNANVTNKHTDEGADDIYGNFGQELEMDYAAFMGWWRYRLSRKLSLIFKAKYTDMDADDIFLDVRELRLPDTYPVYPGQTYREVIGCTCDITRYSAYDVREYNVSADLAWRLSHRLKLKFGYALDYIDRRNASEALGHPPVNEHTTEHTFKLGANWRPHRGLKFKMDYRLELVDDPYTHLNAYCPQQLPDFDNDINDDGWADIWAPTNWYSKYVYHTRDKDMSVQPDTTHDLRLKMDWLFSQRLNLQANVHYLNAENDKLDGYTYVHDLFNGGLNVTILPQAGLGINAGYQYSWDRHRSMFCSAFYHG